MFGQSVQVLPSAGLKQILFFFKKMDKWEANAAARQQEQQRGSHHGHSRETTSGHRRAPVVHRGAERPRLLSFLSLLSTNILSGVVDAIQVQQLWPMLRQSRYAGSLRLPVQDRLGRTVTDVWLTLAGNSGMQCATRCFST